MPRPTNTWIDPRPIRIPDSLARGSWTSIVRNYDDPDEILGYANYYVGTYAEATAQSRAWYRREWGEPTDTSVLGMWLAFTPNGDDFPITFADVAGVTRRWNQEGEGYTIQIDGYFRDIASMLRESSNWVIPDNGYSPLTVQNEVRNIVRNRFALQRGFRQIRELIRTVLGIQEIIMPDFANVIELWARELIDNYDHCSSCGDPRCLVPNNDEEHRWCGNDDFGEGYHFTSTDGRMLRLEPDIDQSLLREMNMNMDTEFWWCDQCRENRVIPPTVYMDEESDVGIGPCIQCGNVMVFGSQHVSTEITREFHSHDENTQICWTCYQTMYEWCPDCGNVTFEIARERCNPCLYPNGLSGGIVGNDQMFSQVNNYTFKPALIFWPEEPPDPALPLYIGLEVEVSFGQNSYSQVVNQWVPNLEPRLVYAKSDVSITNGIELVTYPFSPIWAKKNFPLDQWDRLIDDYGALPTHSSCGTHIHMAKTAFTPSHLWKMLHLHSELPIFLGQLGGRGTAASYGSFEFDQLNEKLHRLAFVKDKSRGFQWGLDRSRAVNLLPRDTIELRYPRGGCSSDEVGKNIDLAQALYDFTNYVNVGDAKDGAFKDPGFLMKWIQSGDYPYLNKWMMAEMPTPQQLRERT